ncbi:U6 snRNA-associated Sm-like protein LSm2, partial [Parastagonospora nodorum]
MRTPRGPSSVNFELPSLTTTTPRAQLRPCCSPTPPKTRPQHLRKTVSTTMLFFSFFKTLVEHEITVELKNEVQIRGTLKSVDQYLNIKLDNAEAVDEMRWPHL